MAQQLKNMNTHAQNLQILFLNTLRKEHVHVDVYLRSGVKLQGRIESYDQFTILVKNSVTQIINKHAIATIVPSRIVQIRPVQQQ